MASHTETIDVGVDVRTAYNQWTQFEEFPTFMQGVEEIRQIDDTTLDWKVKIAGVEREFRTAITEQRPDQRIAWTTESEPHHAGVVTFHRLDDDHARVALQMDFEPEDFVEKAGEAVGAVDWRIKGDLERFKEMIESRGQETGAWRGEVD